MDYPSTEQVEAADHVQLARWFRFLPSPGDNYPELRGTDAYTEMYDAEMATLAIIIRRLSDAGGITKELSKSIGWEE